MNIYDAIMKAADTIEKRPDLYQFMANDIPDCGSPGCLLGWIGHHMGLRGNVFETVMPLMGDNNLDALETLRYWNSPTSRSLSFGPIGQDPKAAVAHLRWLAPQFKPVIIGIPASVREIFTNPRQTISDTAPDQRFA